MRASLIFACLAMLAVAAFAFALGVGSVAIPPATVWDAIIGGSGDDQRAQTVILELRFPRAIAAFATGGLLAIAGALMQVLLRNPLADPYILGVSGGAAIAALLAIMLGLGGFWIDAGAFTGALAVTLLVFTLAHSEGGWSPTRLLLTGVVIAAGLGAGISLLLSLGTDSSLRGMLFWLMGDLSFATSAWLELGLLAAAMLCGTLGAKQLNALARGEVPAQALGVAVKPLRITIYIVSSLLTAAAVTTAGSIGFIGLVVPHLLRMFTGPDHRIVIPGSALLGGALLTAADTLARTVAAPRQLPVGALTALIGVPLFLLMMRRQRSLG